MSPSTARPIVAVVTPVHNGVRWIGETIRSVLDQTAVLSGRVELRYLVMDGSSTDGTVEEVKRYGDRGVALISERDSGMYSALAKGLRTVAPGSEICAYLNAGDLWLPSALDTVLEAMSLPSVDWVCGYHVAYNAAGQVIYVRLPYRYRGRLIETGFYGRSLPAVQQESTFWRSDLLRVVDLGRLEQFKLAGDYYLWHSFSSVARLYTISSVLGGFRVHGNHLSDAKDAYRQEVLSVTRPATMSENMVAALDRLVWASPDRVKKLLGRGQVLRYSLSGQVWA